MLSPTDLVRYRRGQLFKRLIRAGAAMHSVFDDSALSEAVGVQRGTVGGWWRGAKPEPEAIRRLAETTGMSVEELTAFVYFDGPPPAIPGWTAEDEAWKLEQVEAATRSKAPTPPPQRPRGR